MITDGLFSSESVSDGHPDKLADRISDRVLDAFLQLDPQARVACETFIANQFVVVAGEFSTNDESHYESVRQATPALVRDVLRTTGYHDADTGIDPDTCEIQVRFNRQSGDIKRGVDGANGAIGAGDQGLMFGYACSETPELMPAPIIYAHQLMQRHGQVRHGGELSWLGPDAKAQVSFRYAGGRPISIETVVLSTQHPADVAQEDVARAVTAHIVDQVIPEAMRAPPFRVLVNPTGRFVVGGPKGDVGLTGRKIIVDTYGGMAPHGGGAFSGKDPSKVDRSGAYMARFLAKQVVARQWADRCLVQLAYAIGVSEPVSFLVDAAGASAARNAEIAQGLQTEFKLTPGEIIRHLDLLRPIYYDTAAYGHFGRNDLNLPWEATQ